MVQFFSKSVIMFLDINTCNNLLFYIFIIVFGTTNINLISSHLTDYIITFEILNVIKI